MIGGVTDLRRSNIETGSLAAAAGRKRTVAASAMQTKVDPECD
jgi:hypothetical protein